MKNFLSWFTKIFPLILPTTQAVEGIVTEAKAGATKKQLATDSLGVATAIAQTIDPANTAQISAAQQLVSISIDSVVALQNALKGK